MSYTDLPGEAGALSVLEDALRGSPADQTELVLLEDKVEVTRFANSQIRQSMSQINTRVSVRAAAGRSSARVFTNALDLASLQAAIADAVALAKMQTPNPRFRSLPTPDMGYPPEGDPPTAYFETTAAQTAQERAAAVGRIIESAAAKGLKAYGTYRSSTSELAVASSTGIRSYAGFTTAYLKALLEGPGGTGFGDALDRDASRIDPDEVARQAIAKCLANRDQVEIEPGDYEAVFEPNAVADMVRFPVVTGMGARQFLDGQSFMSGCRGEPVAGETVTIWDDPADPQCMPLSIDFEGLPARRVDLITRGVAVGPVYDAATAQEAGTRSTGHAPEPFGDSVAEPLPGNVVMPQGAASMEEMLSKVRRGVWVTRFHYTHCPDRKRVIATGTTRDGTFLVRDGVVVGALRNLRLEMGVLDLLSSLQEAGKGKTCQDWWSQNGMGSISYFVPSMRFGACRFTGVTTF